MENNRFYQNRMEIRQICEERGVTVAVGSILYANEHALTGYQAELTEWDKLCRKYRMDDQKKIPADLFQLKCLA